MTDRLSGTGLAAAEFNGVINPYVPPRDLRISPRLKLHDRWAEEIDPITYEVIRHNLWNINEEHGATIQRISGSPVAVYALDLNPSILTEDAEFVYFGPYMQYMSGVTDTQVKWILEYRSDNPGIRHGDMFLANDPWVGAAHQMDVMLICPVFWEDELFCWVTNCLHQYDIGGITPGSFCPAAESAFEEGVLIPPVKIIENFEIRRDIEELYLRSSRKPDMVALDFRAQRAGNMAARERILALIRRYGPETVKGVMKRLLNNAEHAFLEKMERLPDGVWRDRTYVECCRPGDRNCYRVMLTLRKEGDRLIFENEGTAPQDGAMNATYSGWRGSIIVAVNQLLCWEQYQAVGGALRHIDFNPTLGSFTNAKFPASVSTAPVQAMEISLYPAYNVLGKMIYSDAEMRKDIMCIGGTSQFPSTIFRGVDQWGEAFGYVLLDSLGGAIGAFSNADGISTGGQSRTPICRIPNIEHSEQTFPILFLYRKEMTDSGGAGTFRGGLSAESCFIPHGTGAITHDVISSGNAIPTSTGMMGGYPAATNAFTFLGQSNVLKKMAKRELVDDTDALEGELQLLELRQQNFQQNSDDVYAVMWCGGGGFGDPLDRDPERVRKDVEDHAVSAVAARDIFGVILNESADKVDLEKTAEYREKMRRDQLPRSGPSAETLDGNLVLELTASLHIRRNGDLPHYCCAGCGADLGALGQNYKEACIRSDDPVGQCNPLVGDPGRFIDAEPVFRQFHCPGCGKLIENEVALRDDSPLMDIDVAPDSARFSRDT